ncbi:MAG: hypothetical protein ACYTGG_11275 [Planctomycetota bacterium]
MTPHRLVIVMAGVLAMSLAGCEAIPLEPAGVAWEAGPAIESLDADFAAGTTILSGFDSPVTDRHDWNADLQLLLGVKLERGERRRVWFVRLSTAVPDTPEADDDGQNGGPSHAHNAISLGKTRLEYLSPMRPVRVDLYDDDGRRLSTSLTRVPSAYLQHGLMQTCEEYRLLAASGDPALDLEAIENAESLPPYVQAELGSWLALVSLTQVIGALPALQPVTRSAQRFIVRSPGLAILPALATGNLQVGLDADFEHAASLGTPWTDHADLAPLYHLPLTASVSGHRLVNARLVVGPADPPYLLSGGILYLEAVHPSRPANRLTARVIAARWQ